MKLGNWIQQLDGTFKAVDTPGPPDYDGWLARFKVYRVLRCLLQPSDPVGLTRKVVTFAALDAYLEAFVVLIGESPKCWHSLCSAQDRARKEARRELAGAFQQGKLAYGLEFNPRRPWDAIFTCMAHHADQFWDKEVRSFQFITRGSSASLLAHKVTLGIVSARQNIACASGQRTLPDGNRAGSLPFQGQTWIAKQKRSVRETCGCIVWCWKQTSYREASGSYWYCGKGSTSSPSRPKRIGASMSQLEMARTFVSGFRRDRRMRVKVLVSKDVGMRVSGD